MSESPFVSPLSHFPGTTARRNWLIASTKGRSDPHLALLFLHRSSYVITVPASASVEWACVHMYILEVGKHGRGRHSPNRVLHPGEVILEHTLQYDQHYTYFGMTVLRKKLPHCSA